MGFEGSGKPTKFIFASPSKSIAAAAMKTMRVIWNPVQRCAHIRTALNFRQTWKWRQLMSRVLNSTCKQTELDKSVQISILRVMFTNIKWSYCRNSNYWALNSQQNVIWRRSGSPTRVVAKRAERIHTYLGDLLGPRPVQKSGWDTLIYQYNLTFPCKDQ